MFYWKKGAEKTQAKEADRVGREYKIGKNYFNKKV